MPVRCPAFDMNLGVDAAVPTRTVASTDGSERPALTLRRMTDQDAASADGRVVHLVDARPAQRGTEFA